jgi:hypothetical protein
LLFAALFSLLAHAPAAGAAGLGRDDFAYGLSISVPPGATLAEYPLPDLAYRGVVFADLRDLRVFGPTGALAMHTLAAPAPEPRRWAFTPPIYPIKGNAPADGAAISLSATAGEAAIAVSLITATPAEPRTVAYLVDLRPLEKLAAPPAVTSVVLAWSGLPDGVPLRVSIEAGDSLDRWRSFAPDTVVGRFVQGGERLVVDRIDLPRVTAKFLKLCWAGGAPFAVTAVTAHLLDAAAAPPAREWTHAEALPGADAGTYLFGLGGHFPADRLRLKLYDNRILALDVFSRAGAGDAWVRRGGGKALRIEAGGAAVVSDPLVLARSADREWKLAVRGRDAAAGLTSLDVEVGWIPDRVQFLAQGAGVYTVAYGNGAAPAPAFGESAFEATLRGVLKGRAPVIAQAQLIKAETLGGPAKLAGPGADRKALLLWGVLLGGVALFGAMAVRLVREMKATTP